METSPDGNTLTLYLEDGEIHRIDETDPSRYNRLQFEHHQINIRGIGSDLVRSEGKHKGDREMSIEEMRARIGTVDRDIDETRASVRSAVVASVERLLASAASVEAPREPEGTDGGAGAPAAAAATPRDGPGGGGDTARREMANLSAQLDRWARQVETKSREIARFEVEIQKKLAIPFACVVFVMIGGPLGIRVGRGGIGVSAGLSLGFFLIYYLFLVGGEELADRGLVPPLVAMWAANVLLAGCGAWLLASLNRAGTGRRR
jgi:lipopolysaccharide export system permease protein